MIDDSLSDVQQERQMSVKELILKTEGDSTKAKFDSSNGKIYLTLFRLDKPAAGMIIDRSQSSLADAVFAGAFEMSDKEPSGPSEYNNLEYISWLWLIERRELRPFSITGRRLYCRR